jgi:hypothetical protein
MCLLLKPLEMESRASKYGGLALRVFSGILQETVATFKSAISLRHDARFSTANAADQARQHPSRYLA